jgi:hypothetical protein
MKRFLSMILWLLLIPALFGATNVVFQWDAEPGGQAWTQVRIYERTGTAAPYTYALVGSAACPGCITYTAVNVATGTHTYIARSYNGQSESVDSNPVTAVILAVPSAPTTVTITIVVQ